MEQKSSKPHTSDLLSEDWKSSKNTAKHHPRFMSVHSKRAPSLNTDSRKRETKMSSTKTISMNEIHRQASLKITFHAQQSPSSSPNDFPPVISIMVTAPPMYIHNIHHDNDIFNVNNISFQCLIIKINIISSQCYAQHQHHLISMTLSTSNIMNYQKPRKQGRGRKLCPKHKPIPQLSLLKYPSNILFVPIRSPLDRLENFIGGP